MDSVKDCHYCNYACCSDANSDVSCYVEDGGYFSHYVTDSKKEAEECRYFKYCDCFPKY